MLPLLKFYTKTLTIRDDCGFEQPVNTDNPKSGAPYYKLPYYETPEEIQDAVRDGSMDTVKEL